MYIIDRPILKHNEIRFVHYTNGAISTFVDNFMRIRYNTKDELWFRYNEQTDEFDLVEIITHDGIKLQCKFR